jgi:hypothetical protein
MPKDVAGGDKVQPAPPGNPSSTTKDAAYGLTVPVDNDPASVPADMEELAKDIRDQLDLRLTKAAALNAYQGKIVVVTAKPAVSAVADGAIVFVIA